MQGRYWVTVIRPVDATKFFAPDVDPLEIVRISGQCTNKMHYLMHCRESTKILTWKSQSGSRYMSTAHRMTNPMFRSSEMILPRRPGDGLSNHQFVMPRLPQCPGHVVKAAELHQHLRVMSVVERWNNKQEAHKRDFPLMCPRVMLWHKLLDWSDQFGTMDYIDLDLVLFCFNQTI